MKPIRTWILVADGARGRILRSDGWGKGLQQVEHREHEESQEATRELGSDRPGRQREIVDGTPSAMEETDWHRFEKAEFAHEMAQQLNKGANRDAYDRLVLIAPPQTLGDLRKKLEGKAAERVTAEIDKDLTHASLDELKRWVEEVNPV